MLFDRDNFERLFSSAKLPDGGAPMRAGHQCLLSVNRDAPQR
jgi:hypothetical protein